MNPDKAHSHHLIRFMDLYEKETNISFFSFCEISSFWYLFATVLNLIYHLKYNLQKAWHFLCKNNFFFKLRTLPFKSWSIIVKEINKRNRIRQISPEIGHKKFLFMLVTDDEDSKISTFSFLFLKYFPVYSHYLQYNNSWKFQFIF